MFTWATITSAILGLVRGIVSLFNKSIEWFKEKALIRMGRELESGDIAKEEVEITRKQTEILTQDRTKEDVVKKLEDGKF